MWYRGDISSIYSSTSEANVSELDDITFGKCFFSTKCTVISLACSKSQTKCVNRREMDNQEISSIIK